MYPSGKRRRKPLVNHIKRPKNLERFSGGGCDPTTQTATEGNIEEENELCIHLPEDCNNNLEDIDLLGVVTGNDPGTGNVNVNVVEGTIVPNRHKSESDLESDSKTSAPSSGLNQEHLLNKSTVLSLLTIGEGRRKLETLTITLFTTRVKKGMIKVK